jgi:hypothetical protein
MRRIGSWWGATSVAVHIRFFLCLLQGRGLQRLQLGASAGTNTGAGVMRKVCLILGLDCFLLGISRRLLLLVWADDALVGGCARAGLRLAGASEGDSAREMGCKCDPEHSHQGNLGTNGDGGERKVRQISSFPQTRSRRAQG